MTEKTFAPVDFDRQAVIDAATFASPDNLRKVLRAQGIRLRHLHGKNGALVGTIAVRQVGPDTFQVGLSQVNQKYYRDVAKLRQQVKSLGLRLATIPAPPTKRAGAFLALEALVNTTMTVSREEVNFDTLRAVRGEEGTRPRRNRAAEAAVFQRLRVILQALRAFQRAGIHVGEEVVCNPRAAAVKPVLPPVPETIADPFF